VSSPSARDSTEQIIPADLSAEPRRFIDAGPDCDDRTIEGMRPAERSSPGSRSRLDGKQYHRPLFPAVQQAKRDDEDPP
jgi:hypothetical protein